MIIHIPNLNLETAQYLFSLIDFGPTVDYPTVEFKDCFGRGVQVEYKDGH